MTSFDPNRTAVVAVHVQNDVVGTDGAFAGFFRRRDRPDRRPGHHQPRARRRPQRRREGRLHPRRVAARLRRPARQLAPARRRRADEVPGGRQRRGGDRRRADPAAGRRRGHSPASRRLPRQRARRDLCGPRGSTPSSSSASPPTSRSRAPPASPPTWATAPSSSPTPARRRRRRPRRLVGVPGPARRDRHDRRAARRPRRTAGRSPAVAAVTRRTSEDFEESSISNNWHASIAVSRSESARPRGAGIRSTNFRGRHRSLAHSFREGAMDTTTLPPPAFSPFTPVDGFDTDVVVVGPAPRAPPPRWRWPPTGCGCTRCPSGTWVANTPRAHITNQRAVEVLRDLGLEDEATQVRHPVGPDGRHPVHHQPGRPGDRPAADLGHRRRPPRRLPAGQPLHHAGHPAAADGAGADQERRRARRERRASTPSTSATSRTPTGVTVTLRDRMLGHVFTQRARYLVGADGARSQIAEEIGLPIDGELARAGTAYVRFNADLSQLRRAPAEHPALDHEPGRRLRRDRHGPAPRGPARGTSGSPAGASTSPTGEPDLSDDRVLDQIRTLVGDPDLEVEIVRTSPPGTSTRQHATDLLRSAGCSAAATPCTGTRRERAGLEHLRAGRVQPGLEARVRRQGPRRPGPARLLLRRAGPGRRADRRPRQPVPRWTTPPLRDCVRHHRQRRPGARRPGQAQGAHRRGRRPSASGSTRRWS